MKLPFSFVMPFNIKQAVQKWQVVIGSYSLVLISFICVCAYWNHRTKHLKALEHKVAQTMEKLDRMKACGKPFEFLTGAFEWDREYMRHAVESIELLQSETKCLKRLVDHPDFSSFESIKKRLDCLERGNNQLSFSENNPFQKNGIKEAEIIQKGLVEVNVSDLKTILSAIEGGSTPSRSLEKNKPYLVVKEFHLNKKQCANQETYALEMHIMQRGRLK